MGNPVIDLLACAGITAILMYGHPTKGIRELIAKLSPILAKCPLCLGFWVGIPFALCHGISYPFASAAFCWGFDAAVNAAREVYLD